MASKFQMINQLLQDIAIDVSFSSDSWKDFLKSSAWMYKYSFEEQLLIYAQKPTAKACAEFDVWNQKLHRWINKGSKGIALLDDNDNIRYVFDVTDTNSPNNTPFALWSIRTSDELQIIKQLEDYYGEVENEDFVEAIKEITLNSVLDNIADYRSSLFQYHEHSRLDGMSEDEISALLSNIVYKNTVFKICARLELSEPVFDYNADFRDITFFNTPETLFLLGQATSDISEDIITQISIASKTLKQERSIRTFANEKDITQNEDIDERSNQNERNHISSSGGLSDSQLEVREASQLEQVRTDEENVSEDNTLRTLSSTQGEERVEYPSVRNAESSGADDGNTYETESEADEGQDSKQGDESDGVGSDDEHIEVGSRGSSNKGDNLQLNFKLGGDEIEETIDKLSPFDMQDLPTLLRDGNWLKETTKEELVQYYHEHPSSNDRREFLRDHIFMGIFQSYRKRTSFDMEYIGFHRDSWHPEYDEIKLYSGNWSNMKTQTDTDLEFIQNAISELIEKDEYMQSPYEKMTTLQQHIHNGNVNRDVDRIVFSHLDIYTVSSAEIIESLQKLSTEKEKEEYIQTIFDEGITSFEIDELSLMLEKRETGLHFYVGDYESPTLKYDYPWWMITREIEGLILSRYFDPTIQIPTQDEQMSAVYKSVEEFQKGNYYSQEEIDIILTRGSSFSEGKLRIYDVLSKDGNQKDDIAFLKNEYGTGGSSPAVGHISEDHSSKGITLNKGYIGEYDLEITIPWSKVRKRLKELIAAERYLNKKEMEEYPNYLANKFMEDTQIDDEDEEIEEEEIPKEYQYEVGDIIHIGIDEHEVIEITDKIILRDLSFPLFSNEYSKDDLDKVVSENPLNGHLLRPIRDIPQMLALPIEDNEEADRTPWQNHYNSNIENLLENIHNHWSYEIIRDRDTDDYEAFSLLNETVDNFMANGMADTFFLNLYSDDEEFHNIVIDELFDKTYNDIYDKNGNINEIEYFEKPYEEYILEETLGNIHIDDITVNIDSLGKLIAKDEDNTWYDDAFYDFLLNEAIVSHGDDTPVSNSLYSSLQYYSNQRKGTVEKAVVNKPNQESENIQENQEYLPSETKEEVKKENYQIHDYDFQVGTPKERYQNNVAAIQLLFSLEKEERNATREEQEVLAKYVGWGGLADVFDDSKSSWSNEFLELRNLLDEDEYSSARESTLTAFYTSPVIIKSMYQAIENMGFKYGNILEPSCATGNFLGMLPETLKDSKLYGIELDSISGRIAQKLYPNSNIAVDGYENVNLPDSFFDVAIGNIPFGQFKVSDKRYDKLNFSIHDYFFAKTIDKVRPGGVIAFVTSRYTMDKANSSVRKYINEKTEFIGAIRLPNNAFKDSAGTKVVSDIIFLQKRDRPIIVDSNWLYTEQAENENVINSYFINNPEMVLGTISTTKALYGRETLDVVPYDDISLEDSLSGAIMNIHTQIDEYLIDESLEKDEDDETLPADPEVRNFSFTLYDGDIYYRENSIMRKINTTVTATNRITGLIEIRESVRELIRLQTEDYSDYDIQKEQDNMNNIYDVYTKKYGLINSRGNSIAFRDDSSYFLLASLEILNEDGTLQKKADMFTKRTIRKKEVVTSVDTALEALPVSLAEKGRVDILFIAELCKKSEDEVINDLKGVIYQEPYLEGMMDSDKSVYLTSDEYLSGNIRDKLVIAKAAAAIDKKFEVHVQALTQALPKPLTASEISVRIGATWIDMDDYRTFIFELLDTSRYSQQYIDVLYSNVADRWNIKNKSSDRGNVKAERTYGTNRVNAYKLIEDCLNLKSTKIYDTEYDDEGKKVSVLNKKETVIAQQKQDAIKEAFKEWIWKDSDRRERLSAKYNELFNSVRPREYDGSHLSFPNMNPEIVLREHQKDAVARILYGNNALLAHVVGAGKTYTMAAAAMELKRLGISHKQMFIVPNHLVGQWGTEFLQLYPSANVLVATKKDFQKNNRKRFCSRIATGEYDAIIMGHSTFEKVPMSVERQRQQIESEIDAITKGLADLKSSNGERFTVKQLEKTKKSLRNRLDKLNSDSRKDDVVCFEELGVDRIFVDEAHNYKNLFLYTKMTNVAGIAQTEAQKSSDLFMKCRYLDEITFNKGIVFATGTPISNSMTEMYTNQRYLQYGTLKKLRLENFDAWASTFGETINAIELTPEGKGYRMKTRFAKFYNIPELISIFKEVADIKTADLLQLPVPEAHYHSISVKPSEIQKEIVESLAERAEEIRNGSVDPTIDNMLKITNDGRKLALDQRLVNDMLPEYEGSKVNACVKNVIDIYHNTTEDKSTQLVFCDMSTPKPNIFNVYDEVRKKLIEGGIPESEIDYIHNANTDIQKSDMFAKVRNGSIRILLGSTSKMGAGTNVQTLLYATHDLDCPWRPSDLEQRAGRIVRQGNTNENVYIYRYVTEETFDAYLYQLVENKQKFISQIMTSKSPVRTAEDIDEASLSYAEIKALASGNPLIKEKMDLDIQVGKLKLEKATYLSQKYELEDRVLKYYPKRIAQLNEIIQEATMDMNKVMESEEFTGMDILDIHYPEKEQAGSALILACNKIKNTEEILIGSYRGFDMIIKYDSFHNGYDLYLKGQWKYKVDLGKSESGNLTRIDNVIKSIPDIVDNAKSELAETEKQLENAKTEINKPFAKEEEFKMKSERLSELDKELDIGKGESEIDNEVLENDDEREEIEYSR